jgi:hypothetical protein
VGSARHGYSAADRPTEEETMGAAELRERITRRMLNEIDESQFPSTEMLNRLESQLATRDDLVSYTESLVEKIEATRFPSTSLLNRVDGLLARLEQEERREQARDA